ncbi:unnamed protein product [Camellia sinensis]
MSSLLHLQRLHYRWPSCINKALLSASNPVPSRHFRGLTHGFKVQAMAENDGKLKVPIPQEYCAPVGDHASQLVSKIGVEVRTHSPNFSIHRWKHVNEEGLI